MKCKTTANENSRFYVSQISSEAFACWIPNPEALKPLQRAILQSMGFGNRATSPHPEQLLFSRFPSLTGAWWPPTLFLGNLVAVERRLFRICRDSKGTKLRVSPLTSFFIQTQIGGSIMSVCSFCYSGKALQTLSGR